MQATEVGGTHPALVEAMGYGNCVLAPNPRAPRGGGRDARYFRIGDAAGWRRLSTGTHAARRARGEQAAARAAERFSWELVADRYAALFATLVRGGRYNNLPAGAGAPAGA